MFTLELIIPFVIVAGVWGYILLNFAGNSRKFLKDDILCANDKQRKEAQSTLRSVSLMAPIWIIVVSAAVMFLINSFHPFIRLSIVGVALIIGGLTFAYLGWAIGMIIRGNADNLNEKDAKFFSRAFMISFIGSGLLVAAIGTLICTPLAAFL